MSTMVIAVPPPRLRVTGILRRRTRPAVALALLSPDPVAQRSVKR
jgi:hypothetical protein